MSTNTIDQIRRNLSKAHIGLLEERKRCAERAALVNTGELATKDGKWEHESLLREMLLYDQDAQIVESIIKTLI